LNENIDKYPRSRNTKN